MPMWYSWDSDSEFDEKCKDELWRERVLSLIYPGGRGLKHYWLSEMNATPTHLEQLGVPYYVVDNYAYQQAADEFITKYTIPSEQVMLDPHQEALLQWGKKMGLPL